MAEKVFRYLDLVGTSDKSFEGAIKEAIEDVNKDYNLRWFEVTEQRGAIKQDGSLEYQVKIRVAYREK